jgi:hypothetical protein
MAAKRHKKHKNKIAGIVNSTCYNEQISKFRLFTNPLVLELRNFVYFNLQIERSDSTNPKSEIPNYDQ